MSVQGHHDVQMTTLNVQNSPHLGAAACSRCLQTACLHYLNWRHALAVDFSLGMCSILAVTVQGLHPQANDEHGIVATEPPGQGSQNEASANYGMDVNLEGVEDGAQPDLSALGNWASAEPWEAPPLLPREQRTRRPRSDRGEGRLEALAGMVASGGALAMEAGVHWGAGMPDRAAGQQPGLRMLEHRSMAFLQHLRQIHPSAACLCAAPHAHIWVIRQWLGSICLIGKSHWPRPVRGQLVCRKQDHLACSSTRHGRLQLTHVQQLVTFVLGWHPSLAWRLCLSWAFSLPSLAMQGGGGGGFGDPSSSLGCSGRCPARRG